MKDAKGHGSESRGGRAAAEKAHNAAYGPYGFGTSASYKAAHQSGVEKIPRNITIFHQDGEYAVPNGKGHYFTNDKTDAEDTARHMHGHDITIKHRSKRWGPEMD